MNSDGVVLALAGISWGSALIGGGKYVIASSLFDTKQALAARKIAKKPHQKLLKKRPLVSIFILTDEKTENFEECLRAIKRSGYRKYELIIVNRKEIAAKRPGSSLKAAKGELGLILDSSDILSKNSLKNAVNSLMIDQDRLTVVSTQTDKQPELASLSSTLEQILIKSPANKLTAMRGYGALRPGILGYRKDFLNRKAIGKTDRAIEVIKKSLVISWVGLFAYLTYVAVAHQYPLPLGLFVLSAFIYSGLMVVSQESLNLKTKLNVLLTMPGNLVLFFVSQIFRQLKKASLFIYETFLPVKLFKKS